MAAAAAAAAMRGKMNTGRGGRGAEGGRAARRAGVPLCLAAVLTLAVAIPGLKKANNLHGLLALQPSCHAVAASFRPPQRQWRVATSVMSDIGGYVVRLFIR